MAVTVKPGLVVKGGTNFRRGSSAKGDWAFTIVKAQKGYDSIKLWATNPKDIANALAVEVVSIDNVEVKSRLDEKTNKWFKDYSVTATMRETDVPGGKEEEFVPADDKDLDFLFGLA